MIRMMVAVVTAGILTGFTVAGAAAGQNHSSWTTLRVLGMNGTGVEFQSEPYQGGGARLRMLIAECSNDTYAQRSVQKVNRQTGRATVPFNASDQYDCTAFVAEDGNRAQPISPVVSFTVPLS